MQPLMLMAVPHEKVQFYCNEISPHTCQNGYHQKEHKQQMLVRMWRKGNHPMLLVGMKIGTATAENSMKVSQKTKNRTTI